MTPAAYFSVFVQTSRKVLCANRVIVIVPNVVLTTPLDQHRRTDHFREYDSFLDKIAFRFTSESTSQQRYVDPDLLRFEAGYCFSHGNQGLRVLARRPDFAEIR